MRTNITEIKAYTETLLSDPSIDDVMEIAVKVAHKFDIPVSEARNIVNHTPFALQEASDDVAQGFVNALIQVAHKNNLSVGHFQKECFREIGDTVCDGVIGWKEALEELLTTAYEDASVSAEAREAFKDVILDWEGSEMSGEPF